MNTLFFACLAAAIFVCGCQKNEELPSPEPAPSKVPAASEKSSGNAAANYLGAAGRAEQVMEKTVDTASINNALQLFAAQEGQFPNSLDELVQKKYLAKLPAAPAGYRLQYDRGEGKVTMVKL